MKVKCTLTILSLAFCVVLSGQNDRASAGTNGSRDLKDLFIKNQDYLSASSRDYKNSYGDSLKGFNEAAIRAQVANSNVYGTELLIYLQKRKRDFIDQKYGLGVYGMRSTTSPLPAGKGKGNLNSVLGAPCVNEDFEATTPASYAGASNSLAISGWTIQSQTASQCNQGGSWNPGSSKVWVRQTPIVSTGLPGLSSLGQSPLGGSNVVQVNDNNGTYSLRTKIAQTFPVTQNNTLFQFAYAGAWDDGGHNCCEQPALQIQMMTCSLTLLSCSSLSLNAAGQNCPNGAQGYSVTNNISWTNWVVKYIDLTPYLGTCVTIEFINSDCIFGGHWGSAFFDAACGGQLIGTGIGGVGGSVAGPVSFCAGSNQAMISAPIGYQTYQWVSPTGTVPAPNGTMSTLVVTNPQPGSVYTVNMTSPSGCQFVSTNTIVFTNVKIVGIGSSSTCPNGASGTSTVVGNGSGTGYTYTWTSASTGSVVGNASVAINLAPGVYSVEIRGLGAAGCGSAVATTTVGVASPSVTSYLKPYCSNGSISEAYLQSSGGFGHKWYNGTTLITGTVGAQPHYTVTNPQPNAIYWLSYTTPQGCKDSIKYTLVASQAGLITVPPNQIKLICVGANNGTANVVMSPAPGAPPGYNYFKVTNNGTLAPVYSNSVNPTASNNFTVGGLSKGQYSVNAFDGSCKYQTTFNVIELVWNYALGPANTTLCPGKNVPVAVTFPTPQPGGPFTYQWSPTNWLVGGNGSLPNTIVTPTGIPQGTLVNVVHTVVVTPAAAPCPITKFFTITAVNPPTPQFEEIKNMCNVHAPQQITVTPGGGSWVNDPNTPTAVNPGGVITPSLGAFGVNSVTYNIVYHTCPASNSTTFEVSKFNSAVLTSTVPPLCVTNPPFNLMNIVQSTANGTWTGTGVTGNGTQFTPSGLATNVYNITYSTTSSPNPTVCPASSPLSVNVTSLITPAISQVQPFCNNASPITMTVNPSGGGWTGPNISPAGIITPTNIATPGVSTVVYTVVIGPCLNTGQTSFSVVKFNTAALTGTVNELCAPTGKPFNLMSIVQNTNGTWVGMGVSQNSFSPANLQSNTYTISYQTSSSPDPNLCPDSKDLAISVVNPATPTITANGQTGIGPLCSQGPPLQLSSTPSTGQWVTTSFLDVNGIFTPSLSSIGNNAVQYVIGTATCNAKSTRFINVEAFVPATITVPKLPDVCNTGGGINLTPYTLTNLGTWIGPGISGTNFNPGMAGKGDFVLTHTTASSPSKLCPDQATVAISVHSLATPAITNVDRICNNAVPLQLNPTPVGGVFGGVNTGAVEKNGLFSPASAVIGDNIISYSISAGPCVAYAQATVVVEKFVSADYDHYPDKFCRTSHPVNMNSYVQNPGGIWIGKGIVPGSSMFDPKLADNGSNNEITYITSSETKTLCPHTSTVRITVNDIPAVQPVATYPQKCAPVNVTFNLTNNVGEGEWHLGDGSEPQKGKLFDHVYTAPGSYSVVLNYTFEGCSTQVALANPIVVHEVPKADFTLPDEVLISDPEVQLTNLSTAMGNNKYTWYITGGVGTIEGEVNPKFSLPKIGKYQITLVAENEHSCKDEMTKILEVKNHFNIYIPTSFSPNFDGLNDEFKPVFSEFGLDHRQYELEIFDRWGHALFRSKDPNKGWDGSALNKGEPLKEEVYVYRIKYKDMDGNAYTKMGHVSLVK